jgi:hypothetical protein
MVGVKGEPLLLQDGELDVPQDSRMQLLEIVGVDDQSCKLFLLQTRVICHMVSLGPLRKRQTLHEPMRLDHHISDLKRRRGLVRCWVFVIFSPKNRSTMMDFNDSV